MQYQWIFLKLINIQINTHNATMNIESKWDNTNKTQVTYIK